MPNRPYDIESYRAALRSEVILLCVIGAILSALFITVIMISARRLKEKPIRKIVYVELIESFFLLVVLLFVLGGQILALGRDISENAYVQYEGPVTVSTERNVTFGNLPTAYTEYVISFEQDGQKIELPTRKDYGLPQNTENVYIVYAKHSNYILEMIE